MNGSARASTAAMLLASVLALADGARAQDSEDPGAGEQEPLPEELELTMTLMAEDAVRPEAVTRTIELPSPANDRAAEAGARGASRAHEARGARERGLDRAAEARDKGRELGEEMAEQARENREDAGRGRAPESPPGRPPEVPPGEPPGNPPGPPDG